jgi:hypothetical protein
VVVLARLGNELGDAVRIERGCSVGVVRELPQLSRPGELYVLRAPEPEA